MLRGHTSSPLSAVAVNATFLTPRTGDLGSIAPIRLRRSGNVGNRRRVSLRPGGSAGIGRRSRVGGGEEEGAMRIDSGRTYIQLLCLSLGTNPSSRFAITIHASDFMSLPTFLMPDINCDSDAKFRCHHAVRRAPGLRLGGAWIRDGIIHIASGPALDFACAS